MIYVTELILYKELIKRVDNEPSTQILVGALKKTESAANEFLSFIRQSFPSYTDHSLQHSLRIVDSVENILTESAIGNLTSIEIFCFIMAAIFHDSGMINEREETQEQVRDDHPARSRLVVETYVDKYLSGEFPEKKRLIKILSFVAESHGMDLHNMEAAPEYNQKQTIFRQSVRVDLLCTLLRIGDLLDMEESRSCVGALSLFPKFFDNDVSMHHLKRHLSLDTFYLGKDKIVVCAEANNIDEYNIWANWFKYLEKEIYHANTKLFRNDKYCFQLPSPELSVNKTEDAKFELWKLKFELDEEGRLLEIISHSIYTKRYDHVRELIQNSIDACLRVIYTSNKSSCSSVSPRTWSLENYRPIVLVEYSKDSNTLCVSDNGVGMAKKDLQDFLFKISSSGSASTEACRPFKFPSIASFGIGFVAALNRSDSIEIETKREGSKGYLISISSSDLDACVEESERSKNGTRIEMHTNFSDSAIDLKNYISNTFKHTSVPIVFIDKNKYQIAVSKLERLTESKLIDDIEKISISTPDILYSDGYYDLFNNRNLINRLRKVLEEMKGDINWDESFIKLPDLIRLCENYISSIYYSETERLLGENNVKNYVYLVDLLFEDNRMTVTDIQEELFSGLKNRKGNKLFCVWIPVRIDDVNLGIEWVSYHGFLVNDNQLVKRVSYGGLQRSKHAYSYDLDYDCHEYDQHELDFDGRDEFVGRFHGDSIIFQSSNSIDYYYDGTTTEVQDPSNFNSSQVEYFETTMSPTIEALKNRVYQDGILLPIEAMDLCPVGACKAEVNLTGGARFKLAASRHGIDESPKVIEKWSREVGSNICSKVITQIKMALQSMGIDHNDRQIFTKTDSFIAKSVVRQYYKEARA